MNIVQNTQRTLKLESSLSYTAYLKLAVVSTIISLGGLFGILSVIFWGELVKVNCERHKSLLGSCTISYAQLFSKSKKVYDLSQIQGANVKRVEDSHGSFHLVELQVKSEQSKPIVYRFTSKHAHEQVTSFNAFISGLEQTSLEIRQDNRILTRNSWYIFWPILFLTLIHGILSSEFQEHLILSKDSSSMRLKTQSLFIENVKEIPLEEIDRANFIESTCDYGIKEYKCFLILSSGEEIKLEISGSSQSLYKTINAINQFLGVALVS